MKRKKQVDEWHNLFFSLSVSDRLILRNMMLTKIQRAIKKATKSRHWWHVRKPLPAFVIGE